MPGLGQHHTAEAKQRISRGRKGIRLTEHAKNLISKAQEGRVFSEETRQRMSEEMRGENNPHWKGGVSFRGKYPLIRMPGHPFANQAGYVPESRLVAEAALGRHLKPAEVVHHIDEDPLNNRNDNLLICTRDYHVSLHKAVCNGIRMYQ